MGGIRAERVRELLQLWKTDAPHRKERPVAGARSSRPSSDSRRAADTRQAAQLLPICSLSLPNALLCSQFLRLRSRLPFARACRTKIQCPQRQPASQSKLHLGEASANSSTLVKAPAMKENYQLPVRIARLTATFSARRGITSGRSLTTTALVCSNASCSFTLSFGCCCGCCEDFASTVAEVAFAESNADFVSLLFAAVALGEAALVTRGAARTMFAAMLSRSDSAFEFELPLLLLLDPPEASVCMRARSTAQSQMPSTPVPAPSSITCKPSRETQSSRKITLEVNMHLLAIEEAGLLVHQSLKVAPQIQRSVPNATANVRACR